MCDCPCVRQLPQSPLQCPSRPSHRNRPPQGLDGVEDYPNLFAELIRRGWSDQNLAKLAGGNVLRVMRRAEAVAASMMGEPGALSEGDTG